MKRSAGILLYRRSGAHPEFLLVHPGGPFWAKKDAHAWSIPKGETDKTGEARDEDADLLETTARREFYEETGMVYDGTLIPLSPIRASSSKVIHAFLGEGDFDPANLSSNLFEMEWPPKSGRMQSFPEVDTAGWFDPDTARMKIHKSQIPILEEALKVLGN